MIVHVGVTLETLQKRRGRSFSITRRRHRHWLITRTVTQVVQWIPVHIAAQAVTEMLNSSFDVSLCHTSPPSAASAINSTSPHPPFPVDPPR